MAIANTTKKPSKNELEKLANLAYRLQGADEGWIKNNIGDFVKLQNEYKAQHKKVYGDVPYTNPNDIMSHGGVIASKYYLIVDMDERGEYAATVYNHEDEEVWSCDTEFTNELIQDGFLKYKPDEDLSRLTEYLISNSIIPEGSEVIDEAHFDLFRLGEDDETMESGGKVKHKLGGVMGDVFSISDSKQFKQLITVYNELEKDYGINNYFLDRNDNSVVFIADKATGQKSIANIQKYVSGLKSKGFDIFDYRKSNDLKWVKEGNAMHFKIYLKESIKYASGGNVDLEQVLNQQYADHLDGESAVEQYAYLTNKKRGNHTTEDDIRFHADNGIFGTLLKKYDPVAYNTAVNEISFTVKDFNYAELGEIIDNMNAVLKEEQGADDFLFEPITADNIESITYDGMRESYTVNYGDGSSAFFKDELFSSDEIELLDSMLTKEDEDNYEKGGTIDLFEDYENIPPNIQAILDKYEEDLQDGNYAGLSKALKEVQAEGYTFEYYLDGQAYALRPIGVPLNHIEGFEDEPDEEGEQFANGGAVDNDSYVIFYKDFQNGKYTNNVVGEYIGYKVAKKELNKIQNPNGYANPNGHVYGLTDSETFNEMYPDHKRYSKGGKTSSKAALKLGDTVHVKSENKTGMVYGFDKNNIAVMTRFGLIKAKHDDIEKIENFAKGGYITDTNVAYELGLMANNPKRGGFTYKSKADATKHYSKLIKDGYVYIDSLGSGKSVSVKLTDKGEEWLKGMAKVLIISPEKPLSSQLQKLCGDKSFTDLSDPKTGNPFVVKSDANGKIFILFQKSYYDQVDDAVITEGIKWAKATFDIPLVEFDDKMYKDGGSVDKIIAMPNSMVEEIKESIKMGYNKVQVGMISPKKKGVMLINKKSMVRGAYPLEFKDFIEQIVANFDGKKYAKGGEVGDAGIIKSYVGVDGTTIELLNKPSYSVSLNGAASHSTENKDKAIEEFNSVVKTRSKDSVGLVKGSNTAKGDTIISRHLKNGDIVAVVKEDFIYCVRNGERVYTMPSIYKDDAITRYNNLVNGHKLSMKNYAKGGEVGRTSKQIQIVALSQNGTRGYEIYDVETNRRAINNDGSYEFDDSEISEIIGEKNMNKFYDGQDKFKPNKKLNFDLFEEGGNTIGSGQEKAEDQVIDDALDFFSKETFVNLSMKDFKLRDSYDTAKYYISKDPLSKADYLKIIAKNKKENGRQSTGHWFNPEHDDDIYIELKVTNSHLWGGSKYHVLLNFRKDTSSQNFFIYPERYDKYGEKLRMFAEGGAIDHSTEGLKYHILNHLSAGSVATFTGITKYKDIDGIKLTAVQMLMRDGDKPYSLGALKNLMQEAKDEYFENVHEMKYSEGGSVFGSRGFTIKEMRELLDEKFPDSFKFNVFPVKKGTTIQPDYDKAKLNGLEDNDIKKKLFFPTYKRDHSINYSIYQGGGENTYFNFLIATSDYDFYVGTFGFKDQGDVDASYITGFLAFLQESYGLPFQIKHEVFAKGGAFNNSILNKSIMNNYNKYAEGGGLAQKRYEYDQLRSLFTKGDRFRVHGWIMLKGVDEGDYEVVESTLDDSATKFVKLLSSGKLSSKKPLHFRKIDLLGSLDTYLRGDNNGIELLKSNHVPIISKFAKGGNLSDTYITGIYSNRNKEKASVLSKLTVPYKVAFGDVNIDVDDVFVDGGTDDLKYKFVGYGGIRFMGNINGKTAGNLYYKNAKIKNELESAMRVLQAIEDETRENIDYVEKQHGKPKSQHAILSLNANKYEEGGGVSYREIGTDIITIPNAQGIVSYWERNKEDSDIGVSFVDFDKVEISLYDGYDGSMEDAVEYVKSIAHNAGIYAKGGEVSTTPREFLSSLVLTALPEKASDYLVNHILNDESLDLIDPKDEDFVDVMNAIQESFPSALPSQATEEEVNVEVGEAVPKELSEEDAETQEAIDLLMELVEDQEGDDKAETLEAIELLKELLS
jgi:hypothetical protein